MRLFVPLSREEFDRLLELSRAERRRPQEQAAVMLVRSLMEVASHEPVVALPARQTADAPDAEARDQDGSR